MAEPGFQPEQHGPQTTCIWLLCMQMSSIPNPLLYLEAFSTPMGNTHILEASLFWQLLEGHRTRNIIKEFSNNDKAVTTEVQPHLTVSIKQLVIMIALTCSFPVLCQCFNGHHCLPCPLSHIPRGQGSGGFWSTAIFFPAAVTSCSTSCLFSMLLLLFSVLLQT